LPFVEADERARLELRARLNMRPGFRLLWGRTWPPERRAPDDFVAIPADQDGRSSVVRVFKDETTPGKSGRWFWSAGDSKGLKIASGWEADARSAAEAGERAYWRHREATLKSAISARIGRHGRAPLP
jgi:hypothetical protein